MDIGFNTGRVHKIRVQIQRCFQLQLRSLLLTVAQQLSDQLSHLGFESPLIITFQRALARDPNFVHPTYGAKGLQEGAVGQTYGEVPIGFAQKDARDIAAQGQAGLFLKS